MSYIGQTLPTDVFGGYTTDTFAGDGSATTFTLSQAPFNEQGLIVVINNVIQQPTTNYTVSGTTLTIVGTAVASGDVIYARHTGVALPIGEANALDLQGQSDKLILDADADTTISADTDDQIDIKVGGTDVVTLTNSSLALKGTTPTLTIGDAGAEDTKIVFDGNAQDFYVGLDDSADDLIIGLGSTVGTTPIISIDENKDVSIPDGGLTITTSDNTNTLKLISTDADATNGPNLRFTRDSASPANSDETGRIVFSADNNAGQETNFATIQSRINSVTDGAEYGEWELDVMNNGTLRSILKVNDSAITINDDSIDINFTVESNDNANMFKVDAGANIVFIGTATDRLSAELQVSGDGHNNRVATFTHTGDSISTAPFGIIIEYSGSAPDSNSDSANQAILFYDSSGSSRFLVAGDGDCQNHDNDFGAISDERIKDSIVDASTQWDDIKALKVRKFERKDDIAQHGKGNNIQIGVIAQELEAAGMNGLVKQSDPMAEHIKMSSEFGELNEDGTIKSTTGEKVRSVKYSVLYMKAIKALQEAMAKIETLETKVKALEDA
jgi:hypothetical protein